MQGLNELCYLGRHKKRAVCGMHQPSERTAQRCCVTTPGVLAPVRTAAWHMHAAAVYAGPRTVGIGQSCLER